MDDRIYNFNAGPAVLPLEVLEEVRDEFINYKGQGMSIVEMSHRSKAYDEINAEVEADMKGLLGLGDDYRVLFIQGGATLQFSMVPLNFLPEGRTADYVLTGAWAEKALAEAKKVGGTHVAFTDKGNNYKHMPKLTEIKLSENPAYVHITSNNTIFGTQWRELPCFGSTPMVADMSSDILSRPFSAGHFSLIYAGAQKNLGPAGVTVVIIRKDMAEGNPENLPTMLRYQTYAKDNSLYNTPPVFSIYVMGKVLKWIKANGGLVGMAAHNEAKAAHIYKVIDDFPDFFTGHADKDSRSLMNITFRLPSEELEAQFVKEAVARGMVGLKGHRSVGGLRASVYNGMPESGCRDLADFMVEFMGEHRGK